MGFQATWPVIQKKGKVAIFNFMQVRAMQCFPKKLTTKKQCSLGSGRLIFTCCDNVCGQRLIIVWDPSFQCFWPPGLQIQNKNLMCKEGKRVKRGEMAPVEEKTCLELC